MNPIVPRCKSTLLKHWKRLGAIVQVGPTATFSEWFWARTMARSRLGWRMRRNAINLFLKLVQTCAQLGSAWSWPSWDRGTARGSREGPRSTRSAARSNIGLRAQREALRGPLLDCARSAKARAVQYWTACAVLKAPHGPIGQYWTARAVRVKLRAVQFQYYTAREVRSAARAVQLVQYYWTARAVRVKHRAVQKLIGPRALFHSHWACSPILDRLDSAAFRTAHAVQYWTARRFTRASRAV